MLTSFERNALEQYMSRKIFAEREHLIVFEGGKFLAIDTAKQILESQQAGVKFNATR